MRIIARPLILATMLAIAGAVSALTQGDHGDQFDPPGLVLTWQRDPTTTMTIDWHTVPNDTAIIRNGAHPSVVEYRLSGQEGEWLRVEGESHPFPYSDRTIHRVELTDLEPETTYEFRFGSDSRVFRFRTMPTEITDEPLRFVTGGDVRHRRSWMERTNRVAMKYEPHFIVWGGDLAYADGKEEHFGRWHEFFDAMRNTLVTEDGLVIPIVVGIGNHEVRDHFHTRDESYEPTDAWRASYAPYFFELFAFPGQPGYGVLDFSDYLSIVILDTAHANPVEGEQTEWLERMLDERAGNFSHIIPVYHVPAYPSVRGFDGETPFNGLTSRQIREHWLPLFERAGVRVAFENHDHAYKRTIPIREGAAHRDGIIYIGDGAWGVEVRDVHDVEETWYLARAEKVRHLIVITLQGTHQHFLAVDEHGRIIDEYPQTPHTKHTPPIDSAVEVPADAAGR